MSAATSAYSSLQTSPPLTNKPRNSSALSRGGAAVKGDDDDEDWHHIVRDGASQPTKSPMEVTSTTMMGETSQSALSTSLSSFEIGQDDDEDEEDDDEDSSNDDEQGNEVNDDYDEEDDDDEFDLTDQYTPTLNQHLSGRTTLLRPLRRRCSILQKILLMAAVIAVVAIVKHGHDHANSQKKNSLRHPPNSNNVATVVAHVAYDALHSSRLEEYNAKLTLYRHKATGAEFLAYIPDSDSKEGPAPKGGGGYDPKPDKVFGVSFRTKPESSTGVPHILERESYYDGGS